MASFFFSLHRLALLLVFLGFVHQAAALQNLCSSINTASSNRNASIYQSNGLCSDFCRPSSAFAVLQNDGCWCSNYVPSTTVPVSQCSTKCVGFPDELCGGGNVFGYIQLNIAPAGTRGAGSSTAAATSQSTARGATTAPTTTSAPPSVVLSVQTVTNSGVPSVQTVTFIPTSPASSSQTSTPEQTNSGGGGLSTGAAVGLAVGLLALAVIIGLLVWFFIRKKRKANAEAANDYDQNSNSNPPASVGGGPVVPTRSMSENSRYMLATDGRNVAEDWRSNEDDFGASQRRSQLRHVDPRLDPYAPPYQNRDGSKSHESVNTIQDNHDYSRRVQAQGPILRATNPD